MEKERSLSEQLWEMAQIDIKTVDPSELVDIESVKIKKELPVPARIKDYVKQIKNPYCYVSHGVIVKIIFSGERKLEECLQSCISVEA